MTENKSKNEKCLHKQEFNLQPGFINNHGNILFYEDMIKNGNKLSTYEICRLLNQLYEENEKLKKNCRNYEWYKEYKKLLNENEQLKQEIQGLKDDRTRFEEEARIDAVNEVLDEENERLKSKIKMLETTIARNEGYIERMKHKGEWRI